MNPINWKRETVQPADILVGIKSIEGTTVWTHPRTPPNWLTAETLYWAALGMSNDHEFGRTLRRPTRSGRSVGALTDY